MEMGIALRAIAIVAAAYFIGGIPWGVVVARLAGGPDPRTLGSGRTGGANVMRALGPRLAAVSGILDVGKGVAAVLLARLFGAGMEVEILAALAAIIGHSRSPYIRFEGGRGVSAGIGGLLVIQPLIAIGIIPIFALVFLVSRYSSLASLTASAAAGIALGVLTAATNLPSALYAYAVAGPLLIWIFHHDNIRRLLTGRERRFGTPPEAR